MIMSPFSGAPDNMGVSLQFDLRLRAFEKVRVKQEVLCFLSPLGTSETAEAT